MECFDSRDAAGTGAVKCSNRHLGKAPFPALPRASVKELEKWLIHRTRMGGEGTATMRLSLIYFHLGFSTDHRNHTFRVVVLDPLERSGMERILGTWVKVDSSYCLSILTNLKLPLPVSETPWTTGESLGQWDVAPGNSAPTSCESSVRPMTVSDYSPETLQDLPLPLALAVIWKPCAVPPTTAEIHLHAGTAGSWPCPSEAWYHWGASDRFAGPGHRAGRCPQREGSHQAGAQAGLWVEQPWGYLPWQRAGRFKEQGGKQG